MLCLEEVCQVMVSARLQTATVFGWVRRNAAPGSKSALYGCLVFVLTAEAPSFVESPAKTLTIAEGQSAMFTCSVYGAPKPTLIWQKGEALIDVRELHDRRITVLANGNLMIQVFSFRLSIAVNW